MSDSPDLTTKQSQLIHSLPASSDELAEELGCTRSSVRDMVSSIRKKDVTIKHDAKAKVYRLEKTNEDTKEDVDDDDGELDNRELAILHILPASLEDIGSKFNIPEQVARSYIESIGDKGVSVDYDRSGGVYYATDQVKKRRLSTKHKGSITKDANDFRNDLEQLLLLRRRSGQSLNAKQKPKEHGRDFCFAIGDTHIGDEFDKSDNKPGFSPREAAGLSLHATQEALEYKRERERAGDVFDTAHLFWIGDMCTGSGVYSGQEYEIRLYLADQFSLASEVFTRQASAFADEFDTLHLTAIHGNHGVQRSSYQSKEANLDLQLYRAVADRLCDRGYDNIEFNVGEAQHYRNHDIRGGKHRVHVRHGHDEQSHVDKTARSEADQRGIVDMHNMDMQVRGHHHNYSVDSVMNQYPVLTCPSMKPGHDFAEKIGSPDVSTQRNLAVAWTSSDDRVVERGFEKVDDVGFDPETDYDRLEVPSVKDIRNRYSPV